MSCVLRNKGQLCPALHGESAASSSDFFGGVMAGYRRSAFIGTEVAQAWRSVSSLPWLSTVFRRQCIPKVPQFAPVGVFAGLGSSAELTVILRNIQTYYTRPLLLDLLNSFGVPSDSLDLPKDFESAHKH